MILKGLIIINDNEYKLHGAIIENTFLKLTEDEAIVAELDDEGTLTVFKAQKAKREYDCIEMTALAYNKEFEHHRWIEM